jgi:hypothetical protein
VKLPANECPECHTNLRTGEKPEEYVPIWRRKKSKLLILIMLFVLPAAGYGFISRHAEEGVAAWVRGKLGTCAEPMERWEEFDQEKFESKVKGGFSSWIEGANTRIAGQSAKGPETPEEAARPEEEKIIDRDNQTYFATTLMSSGPSADLKVQDNWYMLMNGEWDVAYVSVGESQALMAGEWTFAWINNGQAIEDVLSVPYQWSKPPEGTAPIQMTTVRIHNPKRQAWEGFHVLDGSMVFFGATKTPHNQLMEHYKTEDGPLVVWHYEDVKRDSFKVTVSHSADNGATWVRVAELWCKRRQTIAP